MLTGRNFGGGLSHDVSSRVSCVLRFAADVTRAKSDSDAATGTCLSSQCPPHVGPRQVLIRSPPSRSRAARRTPSSFSRAEK